jgi:hypothetical protein
MRYHTNDWCAAALDRHQGGLLIAAAWQWRLRKQEIEVGPAIPQTPW